MTDSDFLLHMVGILNKEIKSDQIEDIIPGAFYILEIAGFLNTLENRTNSKIDRSTHLQILRSLEKYNQQLDPDDDDELEDDFERLLTHNPCSKKHLKYLEGLFESKTKPQDLKVMAYLFMRKCYIPEWRELVKEYVRSDEADKGIAIDFNNS